MARELKRITYVEDEPDIRTVTQISLETIGGFSLNLCASGREAIDTASEFDSDMFLLDVMMPEMDGIETFVRLREIPKFSTTPIVFATAKAQPAEVERYKALGCAGVIVKPFDPMTLPNEIRRIWDRQFSTASHSL